MTDFKTSRKWLRHWNILKRFEPGYDPRAGVFYKDAVNWRNSLLAAEAVMDSDGCPHRPEWMSAEESYWRHQERGVEERTDDFDKLDELRQRKAGMDLTISMWKEELRDFQSEPSAFSRILVPQSIVLDLCKSFPVSWLDKIGMLKMVGLTIKQCGMRLRNDTRKIVPVKNQAPV